nr:MFS transporter [Vibrio sinus]
MIVVCTALFFGVLNSSAVAVILPQMSHAFSVNTGELSWVMSGYLLTYGIAIPFYGRIADKFGARSLFLLGIVLFSIGSIACLIAPTFGFMLAARIIQALGGAAFPGLGMVIASRAFAEEKRGIILGAVSATVGIGSAVGPLVAGVITELVSWRAMFGMSGLLGLVYPFAWMVLPKKYQRTDGSIDVLGGVFLAMIVTGLLYAVSQSSQSSWTNVSVLSALVMSLAGLLGLVIRQRTAEEPFIQSELLNNIRYVRLTLLAFLTAAVNIAALIGLPMMMSRFNGLDTFQIGLVTLPGSIATAVFGVMSGRMADLVGPRVPMRIGVFLMVITIVALTFLSGSSVMNMAILSGLLGAGFAMLNTPISVVVSVMVRPAALASALSMNTMMFFIGGSLGAAFFSSIVSNNINSANGWNPFYTGSATNYSDGFCALAIAITLAVALVLPLPNKSVVEAERAS